MATKMTLIVIPETKEDGSFWVDMFVAQHDDDVDIAVQAEELREAAGTDLAKPDENPLACVHEEELERRGIYRLEPLIQNMSDGRFMLGGLLFDGQVILKSRNALKCVSSTLSGG